MSLLLPRVCHLFPLPVIAGLDPAIQGSTPGA